MFNTDLHKQKINLGSIGVYKEESEKNLFLLPSKKTEKYLLEQNITKKYLVISGIAEFATVIQILLFDNNHPIIAEHLARTSQTPQEKTVHCVLRLNLFRNRPLPNASG